VEKRRANSFAIFSASREGWSATLHGIVLGCFCGRNLLDFATHQFLLREIFVAGDVKNLGRAFYWYYNINCIYKIVIDPHLHLPGLALTAKQSFAPAEVDHFWTESPIKSGSNFKPKMATCGEIAPVEANSMRSNLKFARAVTDDVVTANIVNRARR
jgi:hypothetical protein